MSSDPSVTRWIKSLQAGEAEAARKLWEAYAEDLLRLARRQLGSAPRRVVDEEDVAQSVFQSLVRGAARGRFPQLSSRDDLWWLLILITKQKATEHKRRELCQKRGGGRVRGETELPPDGARPFQLDGLIGATPTPEFAAQLNEQHQRLLRLLRDDQLRRVAVCKIEGYTNAEVAAQLGVCPRTVVRKLNLIRKRWLQELVQ